MENLSLSLQSPPAGHHQMKPEQQPSPAAAALHSVRKPPAKPWRKPEPAPPRVYRVDPRGFRGLVQRLTGASAQQDPPGRPLRDSVVPPPRLDLAPRLESTQQPRPAFLHSAPDQFIPHNSQFNSQSPAGLTGFLSPSLFSNWTSFPLLSPGTMASMD